MKQNLARRKSVMSRSLKLGHCVCNPKLPCPCPTFKEHNVCQCAGEKLPVKSGPIALTKYVSKAGCASKIGQADLARILGALPAPSDHNILVGSAAGDDAGVYRIDDMRNLVLTVDVFTPCVDDPYLFGQIAAANSVSDVYAMGGRPLTALSIVGFPIDDLDGSIMEAILRGGVEKLAEAHCSVIGGHSINDEEIKCGFAVTGMIEAHRPIERNTARPGDALVLTKPLGTGMVSFAAQIGRVSEACLNEIGASMATLNKDAAELMVKYNANACTDITGFGLAGHLVEMARHSGVTAEIELAALPVFAAVDSCLKNQVFAGAIERNEEYAMAWIRSDNGVEPAHLPILYDPQTSGGLLISLPGDAARRLVEELHERGHAAATIIGRIREKDANIEEGEVVVTGGALSNFIGDRKAAVVLEKSDKETPSTDKKEAVMAGSNEELSCCSGAAQGQTGNPVGAPADGEDVSLNAADMFANFMKEANREGLIDAKAKRLMAIALSVCQRCAPCLKIHMRNAFEMGITKAEIDEAAWLAISFTGCTGMMFYQNICTEMAL